MKSGVGFDDFMVVLNCVNCKAEILLVKCGVLIGISAPTGGRNMYSGVCTKEPNDIVNVASFLVELQGAI